MKLIVSHMCMGFEPETSVHSQKLQVHGTVDDVHE